ncbi:alpha/beta hydrolase [Paraburkholderia bryophila]
MPAPSASVFPTSVATGFSQLPLNQLPFPTVVVSSSNDPYGSQHHKWSS